MIIVLENGFGNLLYEVVCISHSGDNLGKGMQLSSSVYG